MNTDAWLYFGIVLGFVFSGSSGHALHGLYTALAYGFGASSLALLAKAGGGIYTKTADIAADLVGKVEIGIPEDDPRNPAVIADNVGDNVGDVAGMGADIFDSYVAATVASMTLGASFAQTIGVQYIVLPLIMCIIGIISSLIGLQLVHVGPNGKPGKALNSGSVFSCFVFIVLSVLVFAITNSVAGSMVLNWGALIATISGLLIGIVIGFSTDFFTNDEYKPVRHVANVSSSGTGLNIITGFSYGLISMIPAIVGIVVAMMAAYFGCEAFGLHGFYGIEISAVGMLSLTGIVVSSDAYGPIVDNAKGIAEMSGMKEEVVDAADSLDSVGNTAKAINKGFAISAAALTMLAVTRNAFTMINEIRRQFHEKPWILQGTDLPDYSACVGIASQGALLALALPAFLAVVLPLCAAYCAVPYF